MNPGIEPSGIERAAEQGIGGFEAQQFPDPEPAMPPTPIGPQINPEVPGFPPDGLFSRPHFMEGGRPVAADRTSWWNGAMWVPGPPPATPNSSQASTPGTPVAQLVGILIGLAVAVAIALFAWSAFSSMPTLGPGPGAPVP